MKLLNNCHIDQLYYCFTVAVTFLFVSFSSNPLIPETSLILVTPVIVNFTASPSTRVSQGKALNLTCQAVGGPTLNVTWSTPTGRRVGSVISVDSVTVDDAGEYRCDVTSEAGTANDSITTRGEGDLLGEEQQGLGLLLHWYNYQ